MFQFVYKDKFYMCGKPYEITAQIKELQKSFKTVKEFLNCKTKDL